MQDENVDVGPYRVVVNQEEQYSIWSAAREVPVGWREEGTQGSKDECLARIRQIWTDMRPLSVRDGAAQT